jgi:nicotinate phosphoribosyltransferase
MNDPVVTGLLTDKYELTMLAAALRDGTANRPTTFELFARRLPEGRRYGVVCGTGRLLEAVPQFAFDNEACQLLAQFLDPDTVRFLRDFRFKGDIDGYAEGELYFPGSPVLSVTGTFAECVVLETLALSIFNHDTAIASAAARMVSAARNRPLIEMGSRRTHERAAVAAARAGYISGFAASSNLEAQRRYGIPAEGTSAHAFTMLHASGEPAEVTELAAFRAQVDALGTGTTLLVDTYDVTTGVANAVAAGGQSLGAVRIDSGELGVLTRQVRDQLDRLGANRTRIVVSGDLDEFSIAALGVEPVDSYGVGTSLVTGSGAPTANMVYKLVEVDGIPVQKRSSRKESRGGRKEALRLTRTSGTVTEEVVYPAGRPPTDTEPSRVLTVPLIRGGDVVSQPDVAAARELVASGLRSLPWEGLNLSHGEPAIPTTQIPADRR